MSKPKGLGRGLDALLGGEPRSADGSRHADLPMDALKPGRYQPRVRMDDSALADLAASITAGGVIQPLLVRPLEDGRYEILAGERRWRAARLAGLDRVPAVIREATDRSALAIGLIENIQREDLNPLEVATGLQRFVAEFGITHEEAAQAVGRSRVFVTNLLRLLELSAAVQEMVRDGRIDMGHARALLALPKPRQVDLAHRIAAQGLSVRDAEKLARQAAGPVKGKARGSRGRIDADTRRLEEELSDALATQVRLKPRRGGRGSVLIDYGSLEQLDGIIKRLKRV